MNDFNVGLLYGAIIGAIFGIGIYMGTQDIRAQNKKQSIDTLKLHYSKDENGNSLPVVVICKGCGVTGDEESQAVVLSELRRLQSPADLRMIEGWLAELSVVTAKRSDDEFTEELRLEAYASRLRKYPADVARAAVLDSPPKFWPTWNELEARCKSLSAPRQVMISALENNTPRQVTEDRERVTAARAAEIMREVACFCVGYVSI